MSIPENFDSIAQRSAFYFLNTMPSFKGINSSDVDFPTKKEQEDAYNFIKDIYQKIYDNPEIMGFKLIPDDCFKAFWSPKKEKPALAGKIRGMIKKIDEFMDLIFKIIYNGSTDNDTVAVSKSTIEFKPSAGKKLAVFSITAASDSIGDKYVFTFPENTVRGLKLLSRISAGNAEFNENSVYTEPVSESMLFSRGIFDPKINFNREIFGRLVENKEGLGKAIEYFEKNGFKRIDNKRKKPSLDYIKYYVKAGEEIPAQKIGDAWKTGIIAGIEFSYDETCRYPLCIRYHIPYFREFIKNHEKMSKDLKSFIRDRQKCGNCRFCVAFDRTKSMPPRYVSMGEENICPVFTFGMSLHDIGGNSWFADFTTDLMEFIDELFNPENINENLS